MSRENVELVEEMFARFQSGDRTAWRNQIAEDVIWDTSATTMPGAGIYQGHAGVERFFVEWMGAWKDPSVEPLEFIDAGESIVSVFRWTGIGKTSGVPTQRDFFGVYDLRDRRVSRYRQYENRTEALEAAGLSE
jgi:uncharacterized protein